MRASWTLGVSLILLASACDNPPPPAPVATEPTPIAPAAPTWSTYTDKDGGFKVDLPGTPKQDLEKFGDIEFHDATVAVPGRDLSVSVTWSALPFTDVEVGDTEPMLDAAVKGMIKRVGGTVVGDIKPIALEHHPGRDFQITAPVSGKPSTLRVRLIVVHDRLFRIVVRSLEKADVTADTDKVLASFALTPEFAATHAEVVTFDWKPYSPPDASFTAKFPVAAPRVTTDKVNDLEITTVVGSALQSYAVFVVGWFDEPGDVKKLKPEALFATLRDAAAAATESKIVGKPEPAPLGKIPGEKFTLESEGGLMHIEGRIYLVGKRLFFLQAQRPHNSTVAQAEFDTFFAGFAPRAKK